MSPHGKEEIDAGDEQAKVAAVQAVLANRFQGVSDTVLSHQARALVESADSAGDLTTWRANDTKALRKLILILRDADALVQGLSKPTREAIFHFMYMANSRLSFERVACIVEGIEANIPETPFFNRENVRAIFLVEDARRIWSEHHGVRAPEAGLNPESPFAAFLVELFQALGVGAEPRSAFQAWRKYIKDGVF